MPIVANNPTPLDVSPLSFDDDNPEPYDADNPESCEPAPFSFDNDNPGPLAHNDNKSPPLFDVGAIVTGVGCTAPETSLTFDDDDPAYNSTRNSSTMTFEDNNPFSFISLGKQKWREVLSVLTERIHPVTVITEMIYPFG